METENEELERRLLERIRERNERLRQPYAERIVGELNNKLTGSKRR